MDKNGIVTFSDWQKGMARHPIYGFGTLKNVEVFENKGLASLKSRTVTEAIQPDILPIAEVYDIYGNTYTLTGIIGSGTFYKNGVSVQSSLNYGWDMKIYKNYVWVRHSTVLSCYGPLNSGAAQWFASVYTGFESGHIGKLLVGQDDYLYSTNGNYIAKLEVTASGTPAVAPTVAGATSLTALDLPDGQYASTLVEYGTKLVIGTHGGGSYADRHTQKTARLYSWNRQFGTLGNPGLADLPVVFNENGINAIFQHANKLYVSAGTQGNVYVTDATNYVKIATLPYTQIGSNYGHTVYPNAMDISKKGTLLIGVSGGLDTLTKAGIYEIDIATEGYPLSYEVPFSNYGTDMAIGFINQKTYTQLKIGLTSGIVVGVYNTSTAKYTSYSGVIDTPLVKVGTFSQKKTFEHIEFTLADPLASGQNIRVYYRTNNHDDFLLFHTWEYTTIGQVTSWQDTAPITNAEYLQLRIELDQAVATPIDYNINLISVRVW